MSQIVLTNLGIVLTEKCNLNCAHCMRYGSGCHSMNKETMEKVFEQLTLVGNLNICGGEPFIDEQKFTELVESIIKSFLPLFSISLITNGTLYNEKFEELLDVLDDYIANFTNGKNRCKVLLSMDQFHKRELEMIRLKNPTLYRQYYENIKKLLNNSKHFFGFNAPEQIIDSGNAKNLNGYKIPIREIPKYYYVENDTIWQGPSMHILTDGIVSECDGDFTTLREQFNYGNINEQSMEEIIINSSKKLSRKKFEQKVK